MMVWLKTGDLGYVDEEGYLYLTGREKNLIILANGENVSPEELEGQLKKCPLVEEAVVREKQDISMQRSRRSMVRIILRLAHTFRI